MIPESGVTSIGHGLRSVLAKEQRSYLQTHEKGGEWSGCGSKDRRPEE